jgi:hypothetical protein
MHKIAKYVYYSDTTPQFCDEGSGLIASTRIFPKNDVRESLNN